MPSRTTTSLFPILALLLLGVALAGEATGPLKGPHFNTEELSKNAREYIARLEQAIKDLKCGGPGSTDECGPCLAEILAIFDKDVSSFNSKDDKTSGQEAAADSLDTQDGSVADKVSGKCNIIIRKTKALLSQVTTLKKKLSDAELEITQKDLEIQGHKKSLSVCSSLLKECQDKSRPVPPPPADCSACQSELSQANQLLLSSQKENADVKGKVSLYEESQTAWNSLLISTIPQVNSELLSVQNVTDKSKIDVSVLSSTLSNLLTLASNPSDNYLQASQSYQKQVLTLSSSLSAVFRSFAQFSASCSSPEISQKCSDLFSNYKSAVQSLKQCNNFLKGGK